MRLLGRGGWWPAWSTTTGVDSSLTLEGKRRVNGSPGASGPTKAQLYPEHGAVESRTAPRWPRHSWRAPSAA